MVFAGILLLIGMLGLVKAETTNLCELSAQLINQDPYPAVPGEYVKVVFQLSGVNDPDCKEIVFELVQQYPFSLDPGKDAVVKASGGTFARNYQSHLIIPYEIRIDKDAVDGDNLVEVRYTGNGVNSQLYTVQDFDINVKDVRTDFEVSVRDYDSASQTLSFDILNIGKNDVEALTVEVPQQENFAVKGSDRNIVGSLDSNEDTTFSFEGSPKEGKIMLNIIYTDQVNVRRSSEKEVQFVPGNFEGRVRNQNGTSWWVYVVIVLVLVGIFLYWRARKKKKEKERMHKLHKIHSA